MTRVRASATGWQPPCARKKKSRRRSRCRLPGPLPTSDFLVLHRGGLFLVEGLDLFLFFGQYLCFLVFRLDDFWHRRNRPCPSSFRPWLIDRAFALIRAALGAERIRLLHVGELCATP